jgi:hypothetical protein
MVTASGVHYKKNEMRQKFSISVIVAPHTKQPLPERRARTKVSDRLAVASPATDRNLAQVYTQLGSRHTASNRTNSIQANENIEEL